MDWFVSIFTDTGSIAHIVLLYAFIIAAGLWLGKFKVAGVSLDAALVLFAAILVGHIYWRLGIADPAGGGAAPLPILNFVQDFGLMLFVYCIGLQVGPGFFSSFKRSGGMQMNYVAMGMIVLSVVVMFALYYLFFASRGRAEDLPMMVGVLYGAVTNTPGLGAAQDALSSVPGMEEADLASGYACAYPLGVFGIIMSMVVIRLVFKIKLEREEEEIRHQQEDDPHVKPHWLTVCVSNHALYGKTLAQVRKFLSRTFVCTRLKHDGTVIIPTSDTPLAEGDLLSIVCAEDDAPAVVAFIGDVVDNYVWESEPTPIISKRILVTQREVNGKTFGQMHFREVYGVNVTRITRQGMELFAARNLHIQIGDRLLVVGETEAVERVERLLGNSIKRLDRPNIAAIFLGLLLGIVLGSIPIHIPGLTTPLRLGLAGGPLVVAILIGAYDYKLHISSYMTSSANLFLRQMGLALFLASVGLKAGTSFWTTVSQGDGLTYVWMGVLITMIPLLVMGVVARKVYKFNYFTIMGIMSGATTDPPALGYATQQSNTDAPLIAYSTVYPLSMFLRILLAQLIVILMCA